MSEKIEKETIVHYDTVYAEVERIRQFILEEIVKGNSKLTNQIINELDQLTGQANRKFIETANSQNEKVSYISNVLDQLLLFMDQTAYSYDILDHTLAFELGVEE